MKNNSFLVICIDSRSGFTVGKKYRARFFTKRKYSDSGEDLYVKDEEYLVIDNDGRERVISVDFFKSLLNVRNDKIDLINKLIKKDN